MRARLGLLVLALSTLSCDGSLPVESQHEAPAPAVTPALLDARTDGVQSVHMTGVMASARDKQAATKMARKARVWVPYLLDGSTLGRRGPSRVNESMGGEAMPLQEQIDRATREPRPRAEPQYLEANNFEEFAVIVGTWTDVFAEQLKVESIMSFYRVGLVRRELRNH